MKLDLFLFNDIYPCKKRFFANENPGSNSFAVAIFD